MVGQASSVSLFPTILVGRRHFSPDGVTHYNLG